MDRKDCWKIAPAPSSSSIGENLCEIDCLEVKEREEEEEVRKRTDVKCMLARVYCCLVASTTTTINVILVTSRRRRWSITKFRRSSQSFSCAANLLALHSQHFLTMVSKSVKHSAADGTRPSNHTEHAAASSFFPVGGQLTQDAAVGEDEAAAFFCVAACQARRSLLILAPTSAWSEIQVCLFAGDLVCFKKIIIMGVSRLEPAGHVHYSFGWSSTCPPLASRCGCTPRPPIHLGYTGRKSSSLRTGLASWIRTPDLAGARRVL